MFTSHHWIKRRTTTSHMVLLTITMTNLHRREKNLRKSKVRRNNILYYCIDDDNIPYKGVRGKGIVRVSEDVDYNLQIVERIVVKYLGSTEHPVSHTIIDSIRNKEAIILEITPKFYATWDHGKVKK